MIPYWYELPAEKIAARPVHPYHQAKMLVLDRATGELKDSSFLSIADFLSPGDIVVFNDSKVLKARLFGKFEDSGGELEVLILERERVGDTILASAVGRPLRRFKQGRGIKFSADLSARVEKRLSSDAVLLKFESSTKDIAEALEQNALMPIPPYIRGGVADRDDDQDYQTCFASVPGAIAAPTASLHFTPELLQKIKHRGIEVRFLTLHVGRASFSTLWEPGQEEILKPGEERFQVSTDLVNQLHQAKRSGRRIVAVGTTVVRALESVASGIEASQIGSQTELFITPGFSFKLVDTMVTNFHQPGTTHLLLVEAFIGRNLLERCYASALSKDYRLLSYGDGMLIL